MLTRQGRKDDNMKCGKCKHCKPNDVCNGDCLCDALGIEVSKDDDIWFYGEQNNKPCEKFIPVDDVVPQVGGCKISYLERLNELMAQGLDENSASREAFAEFFPEEYDSEDYE